MENNNGKKWSREETILAYDLYSRIPFGKIGKTNPDIIKLAKLLGRTPDAVGFKLSNLAHFDPALQERNVIGMSHTSKLDREIFAEFTNDGLELANEAQRIRAKLTNTEVTALIGAEDLVSIPEGSYREAILKTRVGQYYFRMSVLSAYNNKCCVTGISQKELLIEYSYEVATSGNSRKIAGGNKTTAGTWLLALTDRRLILLNRHLLVGTDSIEIPLSMVNSVSMQARIVSATITIMHNSGGVYVDNVTKPFGLAFVSKANAVIEKIRNSQTERIISAIQNSAQPQTISAADEIKKYKELLDMGAITPEEYEMKKKQLLGL